jgi:hypothetical protein
MDFIYINENSLCDELCDEIINFFENQEIGKFEGRTGSGLDKKIKDTTDFVIPKDDIKWAKIENLLERELSKNVKKYVEDINKTYRNANLNENSDDIFNIIKDSVEHRFFMIQRYDVNKGRYIYHHDFRVDDERKSHRVITYIWYLNDVLDGGETDFFNGKIVITPKRGKLVLFPASWTYPHSGKMPKSSNKYIITGWLYNKN